MTFELVFMGTGTSAGVPMIGCDCAVCRSDDPRDHRSRPSVLMRYTDAAGDEASGTMRHLLIAAAPEMRQQAIREELSRLDGVLFTHGHADHIFGIDDLRRFNAVMQAPLDLYAEPPVIGLLQRMFNYIFEPHKNINHSFVATLIPHAVEPGRALNLFGATWTPIRLLHGRLPIVGYRVELSRDGETDTHAQSRWAGSLAYCTDVSAIPPESYPLLADLDVLVIDGLRYRHHPTHFSVDQALEVIDRVQPGRAYLTHIAHDISHADLSERLPKGVELAYDGLVVRVGDEVSCV